MVKTSNYWDKRALLRLSEAEKTSEAYIERIKKIYEQAYRNIDRDIANVYKNYAKDTGLDVDKLKELLTRSQTKKTWEQMKRQGLDKYIKDNYKARISRLEQIQAQVYAKAKQIYPKEELEQTMCYKGVINDSYYKAVYDTQMGTGYDFTFNKIDKNMLDGLLSERWSGKNYSQRIWGNTDILAESLSEIVGGGLISGQSIAKTSKQIRERFDVSQYYAERLVRTETNHFHNTADAMAYEQMGVHIYVFVATLDNRTSEKCQSMDGKKFAYKDKEEGVNYPPLHPNCRSKTRGYIDEETEKSLQRRARNPVTGKNEIIDNMTYKEWAEKNGLVKETKPKKAKKPTKPTVKIDDLPMEMRATKREVKNSQAMVDFINNSKNADPKVVKAYGLMGKMRKFGFNLSHGKQHSISYQRSYGGGVSDFKLTIPNIKNIDDVANINSVLHENMHWIDFMSADNGKRKLYSSLNSTSLVNTVLKTPATPSEEISDLFKEYNNTLIRARDKVITKYKPEFDLLDTNYKAGKLDYSDYTSEWKRYKKLRDEEINIAERNHMGGGINSLQDIYDALSRGSYRDEGIVKFGHGKRYYRSNDNVVTEIVANYGVLSIHRPDLIKMLKADKPELVNELDKLMDTIVSKYGG